MTRPERLTGERAEAFLAACVCVARDVVVSPTCFELAMAALEATFTERPVLCAPTLALDLAVLLSGERLLPLSSHLVPEVKEALRGYEDHVLARLTSDRRWTRLEEALASTPKPLRATAVGVVVDRLFAHLGLTTGAAISHAVVRRFGAKPSASVVDEGRAALHDGVSAPRLVEGLTLLSKAARRARELLTDAEVFLVENIGSLKGLGARVALAQLAEASQALEERLPTRLRTSALEDGEAPTALEEDSAYPVGGFSSIGTTGTIENLVTSELIYMDERGADRPDLFDVRFVEGELLYYARDESVAVRRKRAVTLVFDSSLVGARVIDPKESYQRLMWALASVVALVRKLSTWLDREALSIEVVFVGTQEPVLADEEAVVSLLLREFRERGQLEVQRAPSAVEATRSARARHGTRARVVLLATKVPAGLEGDAQVDGIIDVSGATPSVLWASAVQAVPVVFATSLDAWAARTLEVLEVLLKGRQARPVLR